jgi:hypothetical protein
MGAGTLARAITLAFAVAFPTMRMADDLKCRNPQCMASCVKRARIRPLQTFTMASNIKLFPLGLVPAQAFRASRSEAAPYGSE